jgi:hypothetical protein
MRKHIVERTRTNAGANLLERGADLEEVVKRVEVRLTDTDDVRGTARVHTRTNGGEWQDEGRYSSADADVEALWPAATTTEGPTEWEWIEE